MAKGARASTVKRNNANLRKKIFGPVVDERTARLSAKLQELAARPTPDQDKAMDVDKEAPTTNDEPGSTSAFGNNMDVDIKSTSTKHKVSNRRSSSRIEKKTFRKKPKNQVVFPSSAAKKKRIAQSRKKSI